MFGLYSPNSEEEEGEQDATKPPTATSSVCGRPVLSRGNSIVEFEFFGEIVVEVARVLAHIDAQAKRVEDDDDGERSAMAKMFVKPSTSATVVTSDATKAVCALGM